MKAWQSLVFSNFEIPKADTREVEGGLSPSPKAEECSLDRLGFPERASLSMSSLALIVPLMMFFVFFSHFWSRHWIILSFQRAYSFWGGGRLSGGSDGRESACKVEESGSIPGLGRSLGEGNGNPFRYSCLEYSMDRGTWWATLHGTAKNRAGLSDWHFRFHSFWSPIPISWSLGAWIILYLTNLQFPLIVNFLENLIGFHLNQASYII